MAERRMFTKQIIDSDAFLEMGASAQSLYFHLGMRADDDGFVNNPHKIQRMVGSADDDLKILIAKRFVLMFESGVIVIKHWRMHNYIRGDRYNETVYQDEKSRLAVKENGSYTLNGNHLSTTCLPDDNQRLPQVSIGKDSVGKESIGKDKEPRHRYGTYSNVLLSDTDMEKLKVEFPDWESRIERLSGYIESKGVAYKNHLATIRNWAKNDREGRIGGKKNNFQDYDEGPDTPGMYDTGIDLLAEARAMKGET